MYVCRRINVGTFLETGCRFIKVTRLMDWKAQRASVHSRFILSFSQNDEFGRRSQN